MAGIITALNSISVINARRCSAASTGGMRSKRMRTITRTLRSAAGVEKVRARVGKWARNANSSTQRTSTSKDHKP
jgi:hypothetical protein